MSQTIAISSFGGFPVSCGTTTRHFPLQVVQTRAFAETQDAGALGGKLLGRPPNGWVQAGQPHGDVVSFFAPDSPSSSAISLIDHADGLITLHRGQILSILTADCLPVFFYLEDPPSVGLIHAGWRGTARRIVQRAVAGFRELSGDDPRKLHVAFGPSIRGCCYDVGPEFKELFARSLEERGDRLYLDLVEENRRQLLEVGLPPERVGAGGSCCGCHLDHFYSYRKEGNRAYRMLSWIALMD